MVLPRPQRERNADRSGRDRPGPATLVAWVAQAACIVADWARARRPALHRAAATTSEVVRRHLPAVQRAGRRGVDVVAAGLRAGITVLVLIARAVLVALVLSGHAAYRWSRRHWPHVQSLIVATAAAVWRWLVEAWPRLRRGTSLAGGLVVETLGAAAAWTRVHAPTVGGWILTGARAARAGGAWVAPRVWRALLFAAVAGRAAVVTVRGGARAVGDIGAADREALRRRRSALVASYPAERQHPVRLAARVMLLALVTATVMAVSAVGALPVVRFAAADTRNGVSAPPLPVRLPPLPQRSVVFAADGTPTAVIYGDQDRQAVPLAQVAPVAVAAVVDTEDDRFWAHGGVDPHAMMRAFVRDLASVGPRQGGSTITQQLVKNTLLSSRRDMRRKITEVVLAQRIEHRYGKRAVLERYLNTVYFGEGAYGIESAAETYFGTTAASLTAAQAALLAGLIHDPSGDDPIRQPVAAVARRHLVLGLLVAHHHLGMADAVAADRSPLPTTIHRAPKGRDYFTDAVRQELLADRRLGATVADRQRALQTGGLKIHTDLDRRLQDEAAGAVAGGLPAASMPLSAALAAVDPATGGVRAVVGGPSYATSQYDAAVAGRGRQPGSSFKVFTLVAALEEGRSPNDIVDGSSPCTIPNPGGTPNPWTPANFEGEAFGPISLTAATALSVNCAYARLALTVGLPRITQVAHDMGVTTPLASVPSMTLGTNDATPLEMASAYATLADDGVYHRPHLVQEVDHSDGTVMFRNGGAGRQAVPVQVARETTQVLQQVVLAGTGRAAAVPGRPVAGKTGTTENYQDAWFVGYTPQLAAALWMGDPAAEAPMVGVGGINVFGGSFPAQMWHTFMSEALGPLPPAGFTPPDASAVPAPAPGVIGGGQTRTTTWCWSSCGH